jgi:hypothetical protein
MRSHTHVLALPAVLLLCAAAAAAVLAASPPPCPATTGIKERPVAPVYWGYTIPANLLPLTARVLHAAKLVAVFDIDETLLTANTVDSLGTRCRKVKEAR